MESIAHHFLASFSAKVRMYNLQTNSHLRCDLPALLQLLTQEKTTITYHDKHPYTEIKKEITHYLLRLLRKRSLAEKTQWYKSRQLTHVHQRNLQTIQMGDHFTCQSMEFQVIEITPCASLRLRLRSGGECPYPLLTDPKGFIVRVSQDGTYKLRIKLTETTSDLLHFEHQPISWKSCLFIHHLLQNPLFQPNTIVPITIFM
jgi:hypothetical protein